MNLGCNCIFAVFEYSEGDKLDEIDRAPASSLDDNIENVEQAIFAKVTLAVLILNGIDKIPWCSEIVFHTT